MDVRWPTTVPDGHRNPADRTDEKGRWEPKDGEIKGRHAEAFQQKVERTRVCPLAGEGIQAVVQDAKDNQTEY